MRYSRQHTRTTGSKTRFPSFWASQLTVWACGVELAWLERRRVADGLRPVGRARSGGSGGSGVDVVIPPEPTPHIQLNSLRLCAIEVRQRWMSTTTTSFWVRASPNVSSPPSCPSMARRCCIWTGINSERCERGRGVAIGCSELTVFRYHPPTRSYGGEGASLNLTQLWEKWV